MAPRILKPQRPRAETIRHRKVIFTISTKKRRDVRSGVRLVEPIEKLCHRHNRRLRNSSGKKKRRAISSMCSSKEITVVHRCICRKQISTPTSKGSATPRIKVSCPAEAWGTLSLHVQQEQLLHSQYPLRTEEKQNKTWLRSNA